MSSLTNQYKAVFREELFPHGFRLYKKTFYRVINDVVQTLMLHRTETDCTVDFAIYPLCLSINDLHCEGYNISQLREGKMKGWDWNFIPSSLYHQNKEGTYETIIFNDGSVDDIVENMLSIVVAHVIPIFEKGVDCKSALDELKNYEVRVYGKELFTVNSSASYWMYIKIGDYEKAILYLRERIAERQANPYERNEVIKNNRKRLNIANLEYELVTSKNYQQVKLDILSRNEVDEDFKKHLSVSDMVYTNAKFTGFVSSLQQMIPTLENEIKQLEDANSSMAAALKVKEIEHAQKAIKDINSFSEQIELLSIPDIDYFQKLISEQEASSLEYLKHPNKRK